MKEKFFKEQFEEGPNDQLERKQDLRRKRFVKRMERKLWLKQHGYGRSNYRLHGSSHHEQPFHYYSGHTI